jgi:hypothetical protein
VADNVKALRSILTEPAAWLCVVGLLVIAVGFQVGELAQRVARAAELLASLTRGHPTVDAADVSAIAGLLKTLARDVFSAQRWLVSGGLVASASTALARRAPIAVRVGGIALGVLLVIVLLLSRQLS